MSGFFGIFRPQGGQIDLEAFEQMKTAMHREGFDGMETHVEEKIAIGHLMLRVSPESKYDKQPLKSSCGNYILVGHFRLDYRDELGDKLGLTQSEIEVTPDSQLAILAYQKWKDKCVHHLEGDWAFVIYDEKNFSLMLLKDKVGCSSLFYVIIEDTYFFSSDINVLVKSLSNRLSLCFDGLFNLYKRILYVNSNKTLLKNLYFVLPGTYVAVENININSINRYYSIEQPRLIKYKFSVDYISHIFSTFSLAIKSRNSVGFGEIGIFLSGGLDSTSVTAILAKENELTRNNIFSFTSIPKISLDSESELSQRINESEMVRSFLSLYPGISAQFLDFPKLEILDVINSASNERWFDPRIRNNTFWMEGIFKSAAEKGVKRIFSGQMGNFTITWDGHNANFLDFFKKSPLFLIKELKKSSALLNVPIMKLIKSEFFDFYLNRIKKAIKFFIPNSLYTLDDERILKSRFLSEIVSSSRVISFRRRYNSFIGIFYTSSIFRLRQIQNIHPYLGMSWYTRANTYCMEASDPTNDLRLLEIALAIPQKNYNQYGQTRNIVKQAMKFLIPSNILSNKYKMSQAGDVGMRYANSEKYTQLFNELSSDIELSKYFDVDPISKTFRKMQAENNLFKKRRLSLVFLNNLSILTFYSKAYPKLHQNFSNE